jgi:hypothetical protein
LAASGSSRAYSFTLSISLSMDLILRYGQRLISNLRQYFFSTVRPMSSRRAASLMG